MKLEVNHLITTLQYARVVTAASKVLTLKKCPVITHMLRFALALASEK
jgi:hypothetical protein